MAALCESFSSGYHASYSCSDDVNSSSTMTCEASEEQEQATRTELKGKSDIESLELPDFYALRNVSSTMIFSSSISSTTTSSDSSSCDNNEISDQPNGNRNQQAKWKRGKLLGHGGFGRVYKGFNSETGQICATKRVLFDLDDERSERCLQQLCKERAILSQRSHPNVLEYYGSQMGKEGFSIFMEYVSYGSISSILQKYGSLEEHHIRHFTKQIVNGLAYLHDQNIVHRDIKGANKLVSPNREIKLADFGMARHVESSSLMYSMKGSLYWMAPEMVNNKIGCTMAVDIWSLGCTILEMATGRPPWSQYKKRVLAKIDNSKDLPAIPSHLSGEAKALIRCCLQRDPMVRPTARRLLDHPFIRGY
ncbi:mitogen-activated protein kinase kinase kinase 3-like [Prosopis cineraria]|uniref:mitogen-activated protein kinase kinase kinase 3-like n=1 Tax=Prosopis cineraria TaxID=364024 RepID=UPI002410AB8A|nr:mitogen-activated protein kinase kinase kinase 3-like [Prosopis cineraria]